MQDTNKSTTKIDILNRHKFIQTIFDFIEAYQHNNQGGSFAIYGDWGTGKSFILEKLEEILCDNINREKYFIIHYNAWEHDYYDEPLIALIVSICDSLEKYNYINKDLNCIKKNFLPILETLMDITATINPAAGVTAKLIKPFIESFDKGKNELKKEYNNASFDNNWSLKSALKKYQKQLTDLSKEQTIIIIIDELDRCLPKYQIKVLERIHHLSNANDGLNNICIYALNNKQLEHTVKSIFGENIAFENYMKKFIDYHLSLNNSFVNDKVLNLHQDALSLFSTPPQENITELIAALLSGLNIRTQEKIWEKQKLLHSISFKDVKPPLFVLGCEIMILSLLERQGKYRFERPSHHNDNLSSTGVASAINKYLPLHPNGNQSKLEGNLTKIIMDFENLAYRNRLNHDHISCLSSTELQILYLWDYAAKTECIKWNTPPDEISGLKEPIKKFYDIANIIQDHDS